MRFVRSLSLLVCLAVVGFYSATAHAQADYAREQRWADEVVPGIVVGDAVRLALNSGREFLAIYAPNAKATTGVVVVHGLGVHPDWGLIGPLRSRLAEQGYATLSVQMPVMPAGVPGEQYPPLFAEAADRLDAAVAWLRARNFRKIAIVSHSMGSRMVNAFVNRGGAASIDAWVSLGIVAAFELPPDFKAPVLDLYGEKDFPGVLQAAPARAAAIQRIRGSAQLQIPGADHFFNGMESELVRHVRLFLDRAMQR